MQAGWIQCNAGSPVIVTCGGEPNRKAGLSPNCQMLRNDPKAAFGNSADLAKDCLYQYDILVDYIKNHAPRPIGAIRS